MELLGKMPKNFALAGKNSRRFFTSSGALSRCTLLRVPPQHWEEKVRELFGLFHFETISMKINGVGLLFNENALEWPVVESADSAKGP